MRSLGKWACAVAAAAVLSGGAAIMAQDLDVAELFASAKAAYEQKKYGKAIAELNLLVGEISKLRVESLKAALDAAVTPAGWEGEKTTGESAVQLLVAAGITVRKRFTSDEKSVQVELLSDSPMVGMVAPLLSNPAMLQGQPNVSVVSLKGGRRAILEYDRESKSGELKALLNGNASLIIFRGEGVERADLLDAFGKNADLDGLEKALQN